MFRTTSASTSRLVRLMPDRMRRAGMWCCSIPTGSTPMYSRTCSCFRATPRRPSAPTPRRRAVRSAGQEASARDVVLLNPDWIDPDVFEDVFLLPSHPKEAFGANALKAGEKLIYPAAYPRTAERLRALGFDVDEVDIGELEKAEAGLTCMSLIAD